MIWPFLSDPSKLSSSFSVPVGKNGKDKGSLGNHLAELLFAWIPKRLCTVELSASMELGPGWLLYTWVVFEPLYVLGVLVTAVQPTPTVSISWRCHNKVPQTRWIKPTEICSVTVLRLEVLNQDVDIVGSF